MLFQGTCASCQPLTFQNSQSHDTLFAAGLQLLGGICGVCVAVDDLVGMAVQEAEGGLHPLPLLVVAPLPPSLLHREVALAQVPSHRRHHHGRPHHR